MPKSLELVESVLEIMKSTLESGRDIKIAGFGRFSVRAKHVRKGRNPQTGDTITIDPRRVISFKMSALVKGRING
jgi:integration host factor subunit alpha